MRRVVLIEDSLDARNYVRDHAPADWEMLEAADGLSGLDLVRQWLPALDLVILDMMLPDVDGEYVCAQIRELSQTLPILPYTGKEEALPVLKDLACLPALIKPVLVPRLTQSLQAAFERPTPPVTESGALRFVRAQSYKVVQEQRARLSGRRIVVIATDDYLRSWLSQMISPVVTPMRAENPRALRKIMETLNVTAVISDGAMYSAIAPIVRPYGVPLILIAATPIQARALVKADVHRIFLMSDPSLGAKLRAAVDGLTSGEDAEGWLVDDIANLHGSTVIPAEILRRFADTVISVRELEVLWLEYHGLERAQIAAQLSISPSTVTTHWKNVQRKLELDREGVRKWLQAHLSSTDSE
jgi:DNA-binding NarL/FixJ family response regulator